MVRLDLSAIRQGEEAAVGRFIHAQGELQRLRLVRIEYLQIAADALFLNRM